MVLSRLKKQEEINSGTQERLTESEQLVNMVNRSVTSVMNRLNSLAQFEGPDSKVSECCFVMKQLFLLKTIIFQVSSLIGAANNHDNLCLMDPAWHPWL